MTADQKKMYEYVMGRLKYAVGMLDAEEPAEPDAAIALLVQIADQLDELQTPPEDRR